MVLASKPALEYEQVGTLENRFYGGYNVIKLDDEYKYALVSGPNREYLWILARTPTIPDKVKADYVRTAQKLGFNVNELLWVKQ